MTLRKGQHLFNEISKRHKLINGKLTLIVDGKEPINQDIIYGNLHQVLFFMSDKEFDEIMGAKPL